MLFRSYAVKTVEYLERAVLDRVDLDSVLFELCLSCILGHQLAEQTYLLEESGDDAGNYYLAALKVKPVRTYAFVQDVFSNTVGVIGLVPGQVNPVLTGALITVPGELPRVVPNSKVVRLTHQGRWNDPRGTSLGRAVYRQWWEKIECATEWMKALARFGTPWVAGITAPDAEVLLPLDANGNPLPQTGPDGKPVAVLTPEQQLLNGLLLMQSGTAGAFPAGTVLQLLQTSGTGQAFVLKIQQCDTAIAKGISGQTLDSEEAEYGTRAQAEVHQDTAGLGPRHFRRVVERMLCDQLFRPLLAYNGGSCIGAPEIPGRELARLFCPKGGLTPTEPQDWPKIAAAVGGLKTSMYLAPSQVPTTDKMLGLPHRQPEELEALQQEAEAATAAAEAQANPGAQPGGPAGGQGSGGAEPEAAPREGEDAEGWAEV